MIIFDAKGSIKSCEHNWYTSLELIHKSKFFITSQMGLLDEAKLYYDMICILDKSKMTFITKNEDGTWNCDRTERLLRDGHSFFKLWQGGEFG